MSSHGSSVHYDDDDDSSNSSVVFTDVCTVCGQIHPSSMYHNCIICDAAVCDFCIDTRETECGFVMRIEKVKDDYIFTCSQFCYKKWIER